MLILNLFRVRIGGIVEVVTKGWRFLKVYILYMQYTGIQNICQGFQMF